MKTLILALALAISIPAFAAEVAQPTENKNQETAAAGSAPEKQQAEKAPLSNVYSCEFYTVTLPDNWQAILPPTESQGQVSSVFSKNTQNPSITITIAQHGGVSLKTIADMFAEQFKAPKAPLLKNGQYVFSYTKNDVPTQIWVSTFDQYFMIIAIGGNQKEGMKFIKNYIKSDKYPDIFPK